MPILYNLRTGGDGWMMAKFDDNLNVAAIYNIKLEGNPAKMVCDCPGWSRRQVCKHTRMVNTFALAGAIDTSEFYCYETQTWHRPIAGPWDQDDPTARKAAEAVVPEGPTTIPTSSPTPPKPLRRI